MIKIVLASAVFLILKFTVKVYEKNILLATMVFPIKLLKPVMIVISNKWFYVKKQLWQLGKVIPISQISIA